MAANYAITTLNRESILARIRNGEHAKHIAISLGLAPSSISEAFRKDPEYQAALETGMEMRLDSALAAIEDAGDDLNLARAREIVARRLEWRAEREHPHRWGQRQYIQPAPAVTIVFGAPQPQPQQLQPQPIEGEGGSEIEQGPSGVETGSHGEGG